MEFPDDKMLGGLWELPGGKIENSESPEQALQRELQEELGVQTEVASYLCLVKHAYSHFKIKLQAYRCHIIAGKPKPLSAVDVKWVTFSDLKNYAFPKATLKVLSELK